MSHLCYDFEVLCTGGIHDVGGKLTCFVHWALFSSFTPNSYLGKGFTEHTASSGCNSKALWAHPGSASKCPSGDDHHWGICHFSICCSRSWGPSTMLTCLEAEKCVCNCERDTCIFCEPHLSVSEFVGLDWDFSLDTLSLKGEKRYAVFLPQPNKGMVQTESSCWCLWRRKWRNPAVTASKCFKIEAYIRKS